MSILTRCSNILVANINAMLDRAEDPETMIGQIVREMEDGLALARGHAASVIAAERCLNRELAAQRTEIELLETKARSEVAADRDDLARVALAHKRELQISAAELAIQHRSALETSTQVRDSLHALEAHLKIARRKQHSLSARIRAVQTRDLLCRAAGTSLGTSRTSAVNLQRWEQRLAAQEDIIAAQMEVQGLGNAEIVVAELEAKAELDRELAAMKASLK